MPAYVQREKMTRPRERAYALAAVVVLQLALGIALLNGLKVSISRSTNAVQRLIDIALPKPPVRTPPKPRPAHHAAAPKAEAKPLGGSPGPRPEHAPPSVKPVVPVRPTAPPSGGGTGTGPALGSGAGGGSGGEGSGDDNGAGGTDLEQIAGEITPSDYPRDLRERGVGGRVGVVFTVGVNGRVTRCSITRSSGVPELDALTCRLIQQRFIYRPSTDRFGRPIADEVDGEHDWIAPR